MHTVADGFVFHDDEIFRAAFAGDDTELRRAAGPDGAFCIDPERHEALLVFTAPDGHQQGNVHARHVFTRWEIPHSFRVGEIRRDGAQFVVTSTDGRSVRGTAAQFGTGPRQLLEEVNPAYQNQLADAFRDTHLLPDFASTPDAFPPIADPVLGEVAHTGELGQYEATVRRDGLELIVCFDAAGFDKVTELLPHAHALVAGIAGLHDKARDLLWEFGEDGPGDPEERGRFDAVVRPTNLILFRSGDFEVCFEDDGSFIPDAHWLAVGFRADTEPVSVGFQA